jgi:hypothetical protein
MLPHSRYVAGADTGTRKLGHTGRRRGWAESVSERRERVAREPGGILATDAVPTSVIDGDPAEG